MWTASLSMIGQVSTIIVVEPIPYVTRDVRHEQVYHESD
jgi:hypothetical protein